MKRLICILLAFVIALSGCSRKNNAYTAWQEQYDLGVRYLSEGNYEEAIIAFTAAIEIDPKKVDAYIGISDAYCALARYEEAVDVLKQGYEITNDVKLKERYEEVYMSQLPDEYIEILSVTYDLDAIGEVNGTPAKIEIMYRTKESENYALDLSIRNDNISYESMIFDSFFEVSGSMRTTLETNLLLFDKNDGEFIVEARLLKKENEHSWHQCGDTAEYVIKDGYDGISVPTPPAFPGMMYEGGDVVLDTISVSGKILQTHGVTPVAGYNACSYQYEAYCQATGFADWEHRGVNSYVFIPDSPIAVNNTSVSYLYISSALEFWSISEENERFVEDHVGEPISITGQIEANGMGEGVVLESNSLEPDAFRVCVELPYTFVITGTQGGAADSERDNIKDENPVSADNEDIDTLGSQQDTNLPDKDTDSLAIDWKNDTLEMEMRELTGIHNRDITVGDVKDVTELILSYGSDSVYNISALANMPKLTYLFAPDKRINDARVLSNFKNLERLNMAKNRISDITSIRGLTSLSELYLDENKIEDISSLNGLTGLTKLYLGDNKITDISSLEGLTELTVLSLCKNEISDISVLAGLTKLEYLDLRYNQISDISALAGLTNLKELHLGYNQISDISVLAGLKNLEEVHLYGNKITDFSVIEFVPQKSY